KRDFRPAIDFATGGALCLGALVIVSLIFFGPVKWRDFFDNIIMHNKTFFVMHIGFDKVAVFSPDIGNKNFWYGEGLGRFNDWNRELNARYAAHRFFFGFVKLIALATTAFVSMHIAAPAAAMMFGWCVLFFFNVPANYYYVFLALLPVVLYREHGSIRD